MWRFARNVNRRSYLSYVRYRTLAGTTKSSLYRQNERAQGFLHPFSSRLVRVTYANELRRLRNAIA
jgi:hypothetical protein